MKNKFLKHFAVIGSGTIINMFLGLLTTPLITRIVNPNEYGQLSIFTMYSGIALMVLCMGLDQALVRYYYEDDSISYKRSLLYKCIVMPIICSIVVSGVVISLRIFDFAFVEFEFIVVYLLCVYTIIQLIYRFSLLLIRLAYKSKVYSMLSIIHKLLYILIAIPLLLFYKDNCLLLLIIATMMSVFVCLIISIYVQRDYWNVLKIGERNCKFSYKELIQYGAPFIISMGITTIFQAMDKIFLNIYCDYTEVGIYASTMSLVNIFAIVQTTFNTIWAPMAVEHYSNNKEDKSFYQKGNQLITVVMFGLGLLLILCKDVFSILLGEKYREAAYILPMLIFNPIMYTISETTVVGLVFKKKSKLQVVVAVGACLTNLIGNIILVPKLGCQGAAISTGLSYIVFFVLRTLLSNRYFYVEYQLKKFGILTVIVLLYALYNTFNEFGVLSVLGFGGCMFVLIKLYWPEIIWGLNYIRENINILKKNKQ